jgi:hypothetical protein
MEEQILDKLGIPITKGSIIAYGHALGRSAGIRLGKVIKTQVQPNISYHKVNVPFFYRITVISVDDDWVNEQPRLTKNKGVLQFPSRIIVLYPVQVPDKYKKLLDQIKI